MKTDIQLFDAAKAGDKDAFAKIFDLYATGLYRYALRSGCEPEMADHIVGDAFAKFFTEISSGKRARVNLRSYFYQIAYHLIIEQSCSSRGSTSLEAAHSSEKDVHSASPSLEERERLESILKVIQSDLTEDQRHVVILRYLEDFSLKETAEIIGKAVNHIKIIQNRAIAKLRQNLGYS